MPIGQRLGLRCFLEGIEVPIVSAALNIGMDAPSQCQVQLPATDAIMALKPRTLVHVFYYDYMDGQSDTISAQPTEASEAQTTTVREAAQQQAAQDGDDTQGSGSNDVSGAGLGSPNVRTRSTEGTTVDEGVGATSTSTEVDVPRSSSGAAAPVRSTSSEGPQDEEGIDVDEGSKWKLYFCGEVMSFQFQKSAMSRAVILNCMDLSVYWDTCYQYKVNVSKLTGNAQANFVGAGTTLFDVFFESGNATLAQAVQKTPVSQPALKGLLAGVVALLERVGGVYRRGRQDFSGVNDFFTIAELRLKLVYQITAASEDFSSQRVFPRRAFHFWGRRQAGRLGEISSFREIINLMNKFIFHNVVPCPIARYVPPYVEERNRTRFGNLNIGDTNSGRDILRRLMDFGQGLTNTKERSIRPGTTTSIPTRLLYSHRATCRTLTQDLRRARATGAAGHMSSAESRLTEGIAIIADVSDLNRENRAFGGTGDRIGERASAQIIAKVQSAIEKTYDAYTALQGATRRVPRGTVATSHHLGNRLNSQIVRPDIYFVSPPRCNVLFPELYSSMAYGRGYMKEVTRMRLTVTDEIFGDDVLLNNCYYAPDVAVVGARRRSQLGRGTRTGASRSRDTSTDRTLSHAAYSRRIMDHELYVGIVPMFERMNEVNIYGNRTDIVNPRGARVPYVTRAVNHQFFKHRFSPRSLSANGKFNPSAVCGFPALLMDRYLDDEKTRIVTEGFFTHSFFEQLWTAGRSDAEGLRSGEQETPVLQSRDEVLRRAWETLRSVTPTQFLGMIASLSHTVSQNQGSTNYVMQYARSHKENEELLGSNRFRVARRAAGRDANRTTTVAALNAPRVGMVGSYHGSITEVEEVNRTGRFLLFGTFSGSRPRRQQTRVEVGVKKAAYLYGPEVTVLAGDPNLEVTFTPYRITERIERWSGDYVEVPLEDFIRPPWMSDVWRNDRIGAVYNQFFGTGSITDPMTVSSSPAAPSVPETANNDELARQDSNAQAQRESRTRQNTESGEQANTGRPGDRGVDSQDAAAAPPEGATIQSSLTDINVERAVNLLTRIYSSVRHNGFDTHEFIRAYTWRPVATLTEMLGSYDLEIDERTGEVTSGTEGFHSRAFGRDNMGRDLKNLVDPEDGHLRSLLRIRPNNDRDNVLGRLDKRAEKSEVVMRYVAELWESRGLLG